MKPRKITVYLSLVLLVLSFMITYSVKLTRNSLKETESTSDPEWGQKRELNQKILEIKIENQKLGDQLFSIDQKVAGMEKEVIDRENIAKDTLQEMNTLRLWVGTVPASGPGVVVHLDDNKKFPTQDLSKEGRVREEHIRLVVNELFSAGAEAISINDQRITSNSAINYQGLTLLVNGVKTQAPFEISAVGDPTVLKTALEIAGGVYQSLKGSAKIQISIDKKDNLLLPAYSSNQD